MVFESKKQGLNIKSYTDRKLRPINVYFEPARLTKVDEIKAVYEHEVKSISRIKIIKMAVDNLINDLEALPSEEKAIEYLRELYKEAEF